MFSSALLVLAAAISPALATVYVTSPVATTQWTAGQQQTISWQDDGKTPSLANFGPSKVSVYVGSQSQQTMVQSIVTSVDVSTTSSIVFTPDATTGQNGQYYFIRFESINFKDPSNPAYPALAFSSKYTMSGMTGTFSADELAQISAASSATSATAAATTSQAAASTSAAKVTSSKAASGSSSAASSTSSASSKSANGASTIPVSALTCVAGVAVAAFSAMFM